MIRRLTAACALLATLQAAAAATPPAKRPAATKPSTAAPEVRAARRAAVLALPGMKAYVESWTGLDLLAEWESQHEVLRHDLSQRPRFDRVAKETFHPASLILPADRDPLDVVLRRTEALLADLQRQKVPGLDAPAVSLKDLRERATAAPLTDADARFVLFAEACRLRREIAFRNPLLDFDELLFIQRHRALFNHMCDQFYGMAQRPGGGLYTLRKPFAPGATVRDVLANSVVANGRLKGQALSGGPLRPYRLSFDGEGNLSGEETEGGSFLSPDVSYDGKRIAFAYVECRGDRRHRHHVDPARGHWDEGRVYHVFTVNADGTDLRMLTGGTWNDFDPCFLPNGRIAFVSERRGGYLRCGRTCPNYTLYDVAADGSDVSMLSPHETNEWNPSVTHDGRIVYTRWDYVDRHGCTAHHPWITTLDGRDSRAVHGNFAPRPSRPDMELEVRAVPGSHKFTATAAPHHGQAFGSIVLIDPQVEEADPMAPIKRLTPDVGFPETQGGTEAYGTPWPLSETYHLAVYDAGRAMGRPAGDRYGIYLVDAFGNKELVYRDDRIACLSPMPLRARPMPAAPPAMAMPNHDGPGTVRPPATRPANDEATGTLAVLNVYDVLRPYPKDTKVTALRVLQLFPMPVPSGAPPHETGLRIALAGDSVVPVRHVLGTVPVEADGSAHFAAPAGVELFFQALDERGMAVQSMRSATYVQRGERMACAGCHEPTHRAPRPPAGATATPLALRRAPSAIEPDVEGSRPFSYPRLVQPVLDRHCVSCHSPGAKEPAAPNLAREPVQRKFYASYASLVPKYAFTSYGNNQHTVPGQFGARANPLIALLEKGHHDVKLPPEDLHRLTLWLDCASMFYGVYERDRGEAQLRGEVVRPTLE